MINFDNLNTKLILFRVNFTFFPGAGVAVIVIGIITLLAYKLCIEVIVFVNCMS